MKSIIKYSRVLEGLIRQTGIHAAGVVIGPGDLSDFVPLATNRQKGKVRYLEKFFSQTK